MPRRTTELSSTPVWSLFRSFQDEWRADYAAAKNSRFRPSPTGVAPSGSGADYHYADHTAYLRMVERARHFDRNNMIVAQGVDRLVANIVQDGFTLDVATPDPEVNKELSAEWERWASDPEMCDVEGEHTWGDFEQLVPRHSVVDGDIIGLGLRSGQLELCENHRLRHPRNTSRNVVHGILLSDAPGSYGRRLEYWLSKEDLSPYKQIKNVRDVRRYPVRDSEGNRQVFHSLFPRRASQRRGVTSLAPPVDVIGMHDDLQFAMLVKAQVASCYTILEEIEAGVARVSDIRTGNQTVEELADGTTRTLEGMGPGMRVRGSPGTKLTGFAPNIPSPEHFPHSTLLLTFIAVNLNLPVAVLMLDPSATNFSGWRGAMDQARQSFRQMQRALIRRWHSPVYRFKVRQFIASNRRLQSALSRLGPELFRHVWNPPTWRYIEPAKDAMADDVRITRNLVSQRRRAAEQGYDWDRLRMEIIEDRKTLILDAIAAADEINSAHSEARVDWRELAYGHQSSGLKYTFGADLGDGDTNDQPRPANGNNGNRMAHLVN